MKKRAIRTGNHIFVKETNKSIVLNVIRQQAPLSRAAISEITGLNKATVSSIVEELISENSVSEVGTGHSTGGRRPLLLKSNDAAGSIIGIEIGVDFIQGLVTNLDASIIWHDKRKITPLDPLEKNLGHVIHLIKTSMKKTPDSPKGVIGIGIGVPGIVDFRTGTILFAFNLQWRNVPLQQIIQAEFTNIMIKIDNNEANMGAFGEKLFGAGAQNDNFVYLSVGAGIGTGIVINGEIYEGSKGIAGEFGHMTIFEKGPKCRCGNYGCWELFASEHALKRYYHELRISTSSMKKTLDTESIEIEDIIMSADNGDFHAIESLNKVGYYLGVGASNILNGLNPNLLILGNTIREGGTWFLNPMIKSLQERTLKHAAEGTQIVLSTLGPNSCAIGAAASVLQEILSIPTAGFN